MRNALFQIALLIAAIGFSGSLFILSAAGVLEKMMDRFMAEG